MKSRFLLMAMSLFTAATSFANINAQKYWVYAANATATAGKTVDVTLSLKNDKAVAEFETTVVLPEGITIAAVTTTGDRATSATVKVDGTTIAWEGEGLTAQDGAVVTLTLAVDATVAEGTYDIICKNNKVLTVEDKSYSNTIEKVATLTVEKAAELQGDVNLDGKVNSADIQGVLNAIAGEEVKGNADVNGDGKINSADIQKVLNIIAGE